MRSDGESLTGLLLDSSVQIDLLRGRKNRHAQLDVLQSRQTVLYSSVICYAEVCAGLRRNEESRAAAFLLRLLHLPVTTAIAHQAGFLRRDLRQRGITIELPDLLIAATAMENDLTILTDNTRDFAQTGARLYPLDELEAG